MASEDERTLDNFNLSVRFIFKCTINDLKNNFNFQKAYLKNLLLLIIMQESNVSHTLLTSI